MGASFESFDVCISKLAHPQKAWVGTRTGESDEEGMKREKAVMEEQGLTWMGWGTAMDSREYEVRWPAPKTFEKPYGNLLL